MLADTLGNIFFGGTLVGAVGWLILAGHYLDWYELPQKNR